MVRLQKHDTSERKEKFCHSKMHSSLIHRARDIWSLHLPFGWEVCFPQEAQRAPHIILERSWWAKQLICFSLPDYKCNKVAYEDSCDFLPWHKNFSWCHPDQLPFHKYICLLPSSSSMVLGEQWGYILLLGQKDPQKLGQFSDKSYFSYSDEVQCPYWQMEQCKLHKETAIK